jgi:hypothetical protein
MKGAGGRKRGGRKPTRVETDDRPRGYEATRMREVWRDIDHAKRKAGLGPGPTSEPAGYGREVFGWLDRAATLVGDATTWLAANAADAFAAITSRAELLRAVPLVGRLVDLVPTAPPPHEPPPAPRRHSNGATRQSVGEADEPSGPDGGWVH